MKTLIAKQWNRIRGNPMLFSGSLLLIFLILGATILPWIYRGVYYEHEFKNYEPYLRKGIIYNYEPIKVKGKKISDLDYTLTEKDYIGKYIIIKRGKKNYYVGKKN